MLWAGTPLTVNPCDSSQRETVGDVLGSRAKPLSVLRGGDPFVEVRRVFVGEGFDKLLGREFLLRRTLQLQVHIEVQIVADRPQVVLTHRFGAGVARQGYELVFVDRLRDERPPAGGLRHLSCRNRQQAGGNASARMENLAAIRLSPVVRSRVCFVVQIDP